VPKIFVDDEKDDVQYDEDAHGGRVLQEVNLLGEAERQDQH
jgi:hypothetical protein